MDLHNVLERGCGRSRHMKLPVLDELSDVFERNMIRFDDDVRPANTCLRGRLVEALLLSRGHSHDDPVLLGQ